jgi:hypothetical protein
MKEIPFRKSMRWADLDFAFGRPIQWIVALFGADVVPLEIARIKAGGRDVARSPVPRADDRAAPVCDRDRQAFELRRLRCARRT